MEAKLIAVRERLFTLSVKAALIFVMIFYLVIVVMVFGGGWTFFNEAIGDVLILLLMTSAYVFMVGLYYLAHKHDMKWVYMLVIAFCLVYIQFAASKLSEVQGEDERWLNLRRQIKAGRDAR